MNELDKKAYELSELLKSEFNEVELNVVTNYTLADAIREGSLVTEQAYTWQQGECVCALTAAVIAAKARGYM